MAVPDGQPSVRANDVKDASSMRLLIEASLLDCSESRRRGTGGGIFFVFLSGRWACVDRCRFCWRPPGGGLHPAFAFVLASVLCLRASRVAPVRLPLRWHPRYDLPLQASPRTGATHAHQRHSADASTRAKRGCHRKGKKTKTTASPIRANHRPRSTDKSSATREGARRPRRQKKTHAQGSTCV